MQYKVRGKSTGYGLGLVLAHQAKFIAKLLQWIYAERNKLLWGGGGGRVWRVDLLPDKQLLGNHKFEVLATIQVYFYIIN